MIHPSEGALHDPSPLKDVKTADALRPFDDLHANSRPGTRLIDDVTTIGTIDQGSLHPLQTRPCGDPQGWQTVAILDRGRRKQQGEDQTEDIDRDVSLAALDLLSGVESFRTPHALHGSVGLRPCGSN
jgi:hypothetical protein